jgi:ubiquinone/menaquinone biosynthesis C-methylase UbiE
MSEPKNADGTPRKLDAWDTGSHPEFLKSYEQRSRSAETADRFRSVRDKVLRVAGESMAGRRLRVVDIGCGAGAQSQFWTDLGHWYLGIDINEPLIVLARQRAGESGSDAQFEVGSATSLPCANDSADICLMPELLEHVVDWTSCVNEAIRVLRPGGFLYISTSNWLCPRQQEFNLPLYSWYPGRLKRYFERRALTDRPDLANFAKYPAVHWFSYYQLRGYLSARGLTCKDRFDLADARRKGRLAKAALAILQTVPPMRLLGHVCTPYTVVVANKPTAEGA